MSPLLVGTPILLMNRSVTMIVVIQYHHVLTSLQNEPKNDIGNQRTTMEQEVVIFPPFAHRMCYCLHQVDKQYVKSIETFVRANDLLILPSLLVHQVPRRVNP